jgi:hypothetical protein
MRSVIKIRQRSTAYRFSLVKIFFGSNNDFIKIQAA